MEYIKTNHFIEASCSSIIQKNLNIFKMITHNPSATKFIQIPFLIIIILLYRSHVQAQDIFLHCPTNSPNYTSGSEYETNLKNFLLPSLVSNGSINGFFNTSVGTNPNNTVYGLVQCRGDISMDDCRTCLNSSTVVVIRKCSNRIDVDVRLDTCLLRYSNTRFFGQVDQSMLVWFPNEEKVNNLDVFNSQLGKLMTDLMFNASSDSSRFEVGSFNYNDFSKIYGMVQCTRDLSRYSCTSCLQDMISRISSLYNGSRSGYIMTQSCFIRYDDNMFYELQPPPPPALDTVSGSISPPPSDSEPPPGPEPSVNIVAVAVPVVVGVSLMLLAVCFYCLRKKKSVTSKSYVQGASRDPMANQDSLQFDLVTIRDATNEFSDANKLGEGGFGAVYKGKLQDGQEIAVKRLSVNSGQGLQEFKNEVVLLNKLQHRNLVRLLGFCFEGHEQILIYEHVANRSLDKYIFDTRRKVLLDWEKRYKIIGGIARGLLYLHEDSRLRIIHRDLKAGNILLTEEMEAKVADFGLAKLFEIDQTHGNTSRVAGTLGYMAPEYALHGLFSVKSDVYSFGVLLLEIVSGRKITNFHQSSSTPDLLSYAWKNWRKGTPLEVLDPTLFQSSSGNEVIRVIHIGLLCVQDNIEDRPTMSSVVLMLSSYSITLTSPSQPEFLQTTFSVCGTYPR
ncbi:cysteine-rich receptor-like protein kinase 10 isoform X2 [Papaver somniferum]|uniref:cysteine-rich receptor-like protein kinase 10 isoform X2 n=1 Tax=Papaver somniferum TaxID=3469 RepID=UPI000E6FA628|nr:cysteine-rich receptor-like protein kinase 10 isoform X2 [Papaver somniferum]